MNTESEAKELWCPMQQEPRSREFASSGDGCIASQCAMWRWTPPPLHMLDETPKFGYLERGYCGLAGKVWTEA